MSGYCRAKEKIIVMQYDARLFGKRLKTILNMLEISQNELAKLCSLTPAAISQIINGRRDPTLSTVVKILNIIPVKFENLVKIKMPKQILDFTNRKGSDYSGHD